MHNRAMKIQKLKTPKQGIWFFDDIFITKRHKPTADLLLEIFLKRIQKNLLFNREIFFACRKSLSSKTASSTKPSQPIQ